MPAGVTLSMVAAVLIPVCIVTVLLRQLPYSFIKALKGSQFIGLLGMTMPVGVMTVLVVYTVFGQKEAPGGILAALIGVAITAGLHWWRKDSALSIFGGTAAYMVLVNFVF
ncbi:branched-chain amino acid transporter permease [Corynebacterium striatum]|uniref:AzlD domain-containing protein n=2 Tax=Corynebacterium striatum TaxID=43770 RepID=A0AAQ1TYG1_CORST|nr:MULTISPECIES: AzlD domain-containing protein [Corynebacterium]MCP9186015.1 AzlD domain-containing protein [Acinetobacter baumannii]ATZ06632.1 branched-chain amino acid ABC transporter permease [Corynebacterium striatum]ATZ08972.1 branched-chain amino acid ABC transporter permease [Corynebacterium striatum]EEI77280.1 Branched-chain amino acid transport protein (AzlD) [Corynebacterium striatum ATCC 6940]EGT5576421.1 branched-chain amino acid ABC transporter permease [Corynebacterium striatum]